MVWMGNSSPLFAIIVRNNKFLAANPSQIINVTSLCRAIRWSLVSNGVAQENISDANADGGAVCFNKQTHELIYPVATDINAVVGKACPYLY